MNKAILLALVLSGAGACFMSSSEGERLSKTVRDLDRRLETMEKNRERLMSAVSSSEGQVARLEKLMNEATRVLTRNSADFGAQVQELQTQMGALEGRLEEIRHGLEQLGRNLASVQTDLTARVDSIQKKAGLDPVVQPADIPQNKVDHFALAYRRYQERSWTVSRALFREYIQRYAQDDQADNAQYWIGMTLVGEGRPQAAVGELRRVIEEHADGDAVDDSMFAMAEAFLALKACTDARTLFDALVRRFPDSTLATDARSKLRTLRRPPAGMCIS
ncbi:MAG: tetratricopeptide repeat protein [Deltaproteobacteria bacterium]|nr:tetratricopeptide repeat protein [Deltaproteobacteria bacterium]